MHYATVQIVNIIYIVALIDAPGPKDRQSARSRYHSMFNGPTGTPAVASDAGAVDAAATAVAAACNWFWPAASRQTTVICADRWGGSIHADAPFIQPRMRPSIFSGD